MTDPIATIRSADELIEALRLRKDQLKLSNTFVDDVGGLTSGHCDKVLGPLRVKKLSHMTIDLFMEIFAVELIMVPNVEAAKRMERRWEERNPSQYRPNASVISMKLVERAKPFVFKDQTHNARMARSMGLSKEKRSAIARKAARIRWKRVKAARRASAATA